MRKRWFTEEQILKGHEAGTPTGDLIHRHGIPRENLLPVAREVRGMEVSDARRLRQFEEENHRLNRLVVD